MNLGVGGIVGLVGVGLFPVGVYWGDAGAVQIRLFICGGGAETRQN